MPDNTSLDDRTVDVGSSYLCLGQIINMSGSKRVEIDFKVHALCICNSAP